MSKKTILDLNHFCLYGIFRQIKTNCEMENTLHNSRIPANYWDLINFVISGERFVETFRDWNDDLYKKFLIEFVFLEKARRINIDLVEKYDSLQTFCERDKEKYWTLYVNAIKENKVVDRFLLEYRPNKYYPEHLDRVQALMNAINHKKTLFKLDINLHGYSLENVPQLGQLKYLHLNVRMNAENLVQLCRSNPYLKYLTFSNTEIYGRFADIVPFCNQLESLTLTMKTDTDASEYAALAKLIKLESLRLEGYHQEGTLVKLFQGLKSMCLAELDIPDALLTKEETQKVMEIKSLSTIGSGFTDMANLEHLSAPKQITIYARPGQLLLLDPLIQLLENSELGIMQEKGPFLSIKFIKKLGTLIVECESDDEMDNELEEDALSNITNFLTRTFQFLNFSKITLYGPFNGQIRQAIFQSLESKQPQILKVLEYFDCENIPLEHASILANIRSLARIDCHFDNLKEIIAIKVMQLNGITEIANRVDSIETDDCSIRVIRTDNIVTLNLSLDTTITVDDFAPLANLNNLIHLVINTKYQSFISLIKLIKNLQELDIKDLDSEDLIDVSQVCSLKNLKFGVYGSSSINIHHLAALNHLESLTIKKHPKGSLRTLLNALASKTDQVLQCLSIQQSLTSEEIVELVGINSLQRLQLGVPNGFNKVETPFNLELIAKLPKLKELNINFDYEKETVDSLLRALIVKSPQRLLSLSISSRDIRLISQLQELQSLECIVDLMEDVIYITTLRDLTELQIHNCEKTSMCDLLKGLKVIPNLQSLLLDDTRLQFLDVVELTKLNWLTRLRLGVAEKQLIFKLTELKNLEVLEITSVHFATEDEGNFCVSFIESCLNLKSITLYGYIKLLTVEFVDAIFKSIKTLRNPEIHPQFKLRGKRHCFYDDENRMLLHLNDAYIQLEITDEMELYDEDSHFAGFYDGKYMRRSWDLSQLDNTRLADKSPV